MKTCFSLWDNKKICFSADLRESPLHSCWDEPRQLHTSSLLHISQIRCELVVVQQNKIELDTWITVQEQNGESFLHFFPLKYNKDIKCRTFCRWCLSFYCFCQSHTHTQTHLKPSFNPETHAHTHTHLLEETQTSFCSHQAVSINWETLHRDVWGALSGILEKQWQLIWTLAGRAQGTRRNIFTLSTVDLSPLPRNTLFQGAKPEYRGGDGEIFLFYCTPKLSWKMGLTFPNAMNHFSSLIFISTPLFPSPLCQMSFRPDWENMHGKEQYTGWGAASHAEGRRGNGCGIIRRAGTAGSIAKWSQKAGEGMGGGGKCWKNRLTKITPIKHFINIWKNKI